MLRIDTATPTAITTTFTSFGHSISDDHKLAEALVYVDPATYHFITGKDIHKDIEI